MKITMCVCGGIASYKTADLASVLHQKGYDLQVVMTKSATQFITPMTLEVLSKNKVVVDMFEESNSEYVGHIEYAQNTDLILVVPVTANVIGKSANGIADDMVTSILIAASAPILFVPSMNSVMYENKIVQSNIERLKNFGYKFMEPDTGMLACGVNGKGKIPKTEEIVKAVEDMLK